MICDTGICVYYGMFYNSGDYKTWTAIYLCARALPLCTYSQKHRGTPYRRAHVREISKPSNLLLENSLWISGVRRGRKPRNRPGKVLPDNHGVDPGGLAHRSCQQDHNLSSGSSSASSSNKKCSAKNSTHSKYCGQDTNSCDYFSLLRWHCSSSRY